MGVSLTQRHHRQTHQLIDPAIAPKRKKRIKSILAKPMANTNSGKEREREREREKDGKLSKICSIVHFINSIMLRNGVKHAEIGEFEERNGQRIFVIRGFFQHVVNEVSKRTH